MSTDIHAIPTPHMDELKRMAKEVEEYAEAHRDQLADEQAAIRAAIKQAEAQKLGAEINVRLKAMPDPE